MGQNESTFRKTYAETVSELSTVQLSEIHDCFGELYKEAGGSKGVVVDREAFSKYLNLPVTVGDRLFDAFDKKKVSTNYFGSGKKRVVVMLYLVFRPQAHVV